MTKKRSMRWLSALVAVVLCLGMLTVLPRGRFSPVEMMEVEAANVENIVARADYLYSLKWTPQKTIYSYGQQSTFVAGNSYRLPYGMPVNTMTFIGYDISIEDFIEETENSSSLLYTSSSGWSGSSYSSAWYCPYYSMDCSTFVSWCWGLSSRQTTYGLENYGTYIGACTTANASKLQLGDALNSSGHVGLVTGISDGKYEVTEMTPPVLKRTTYSSASKLVADWGTYSILRPTNYKTNTVTINYNVNGGTIAENDTYYAASNGKIYRKSDDKLSRQTWEYGSGGENGLMNASTYHLSREGYTFLGWSTSKSGGTIYDQSDTSLTANDIFPDIATKSGTVVMYAQWEKNTLSINYNTNGGTIASDSNYYAVSNGDIYKVSTQSIATAKWAFDYLEENGLANASTFKLTREGYTFLGWSLTKSGGTIYDQSDNTITAETLFPDIYTKSGTVMLYAQWEKNTLKIHYNANGGTIATDSKYYVGANDDIYRVSDDKLMGPTWDYGFTDENGLSNASSIKLTREGYTFLGWSLSSSGGTIFDQHDSTVSAIDLFPDITNTSGTVTLYAQWEKNTLKIHYNANGGTIAADSKYYVGANDDIYRVSDDKLMGPTWDYGFTDENGLSNASSIKLTREGYTFLGWSLSSSGGTIFDQHDSTVSAIDLFPDITNTSGTVTLYAQWQKNQVVGDVNLDGTVSVLDVVALQKYLLAQYDFAEENFANAEMDGDGSVNAFDLAYLKRSLLS